MFDRLRSLFVDSSSTRVEPASEQLSTALLLLELARADFDTAAVEIERIRALLAQRFGLPADEVDALLREAQARAQAAVSLYDYVTALNVRLDAEGKRELMRMLWQVANADGRIDANEEYLLHKLAGLLYVSDADYVRAKLSVLGD